MSQAVRKERLLNDPDLSLACSASSLVGLIGAIVGATTVQSLANMGFFADTMALYKRVVRKPLRVEWWELRSKCGVVDMTLAQLILVGGFGTLCAMKRVTTCIQLPLWSEWLDIAISVVKMNEEARISEGENMSYFLVYHALGYIEAAARHETQHPILLESKVISALDYVCINDLAYYGTSLAAPAAGAAVALLGRNEGEGGKTLSRETVAAVLRSVTVCFQPGNFTTARSISYVLSNFNRITTMCISDANKRLVLERDELVEMLLDCLLLSNNNPRYGQAGGEALQEACAGLLLDLALFGPGASVLRSQRSVLDALHAIVKL
eukprot:SAG31_NODE_11149_length_1061_cov_0.694387_1_plen_322_part_10